MRKGAEKCSAFFRTLQAVSFGHKIKKHRQISLNSLSRKSRIRPHKNRPAFFSVILIRGIIFQNRKAGNVLTVLKISYPISLKKHQPTLFLTDRIKDIIIDRFIKQPAHLIPIMCKRKDPHQFCDSSFQSHVIRFQ